MLTKTTKGMLIPELRESDHLVADRVRCALVVEKDAVFQTIVTSDHWRLVASSVAVITVRSATSLVSTAR